jgi:hypothetical protein
MVHILVIYELVEKYLDKALMIKKIACTQGKINKNQDISMRTARPP